MLRLRIQESRMQALSLQFQIRLRCWKNNYSTRVVIFSVVHFLSPYKNFKLDLDHWKNYSTYATSAKFVIAYVFMGELQMVGKTCSLVERASSHIVVTLWDFYWGCNDMYFNDIFDIYIYLSFHIPHFRDFHTLINHLYIYLHVSFHSQTN